MKKDINYYMELPYKIELHRISPDEGGGFIAEVPDLGRLSTNAWGKTADDALSMLEEIKRDNIEDLLAQGLDVPEPQGEKIYSGRTNLRMSPSLHQELAEKAERENVSLNALINNLIHYALGGERALQAVASTLKNREVVHKFERVERVSLEGAEKLRQKFQSVQDDSEEALIILEATA